MDDRCRLHLPAHETAKGDAVILLSRVVVTFLGYVDPINITFSDKKIETFFEATSPMYHVIQ